MEKVFVFLLLSNWLFNTVATQHCPVELLQQALHHGPLGEKLQELKAPEAPGNTLDFIKICPVFHYVFWYQTETLALTFMHRKIRIFAFRGARNNKNVKRKKKKIKKIMLLAKGWFVWVDVEWQIEGAKILNYLR